MQHIGHGLSSGISMTWTTVTDYMATETVRLSPGSVPVQSVQLVLGEWHCPVDLQVCLHYAVTEENRSGRTQVVQTDL